MKKTALVVAGFLALALGGVGLLLPIWPTTPFVLVAAGCFGSSSPRLYAWLAASPLFGEFVHHYKEKTGVSRRNKTGALCFLWAMLALSAWLIGKPVMVAVLAVIGAAVTAHILLLKTKAT